MKTDLRVIIGSFLVFFVLVNKAFGVLSLYYFTFIIHFGFCAYIAYEKKLYKQLALVSSGVFFLYFFPSYFQLLPLVAFTFLLFKEQYFVGFTLLLISFLDVTFNLHLSQYLYSSVGFILLFVSFHHFKVITIGLKISACLLTGSILFNMKSSKEYCTENYSNSVEFYRPSKVFNKIAGISYCSESDNFEPVRSLVHNTIISDSIPGIIISEINVENENISVPDAHWQQGGSWSNNLFSGNQFYLEAIARDGGFYTNKGSVLVQEGRRILFNHSLFDNTSLVIEKNERLYFHDSDIFSSIIANYQQNFIKEIFSSGFRPKLIRLICVVALLTILCLLFQYLLGIKIGLLLLVILGFLDINLPISGELRMVGEIVNSHENVKFNSVPKSLVLSGYNYTIGNCDANLLIVESGRKATWKGESMIVCGASCEIEFLGDFIKTGELPMGNLDDLIDVREIEYKGISKTGKMNIDKVKVIATDSPGIIKWEKYLKY